MTSVLDTQRPNHQVRTRGHMRPIHINMKTSRQVLLLVDKEQYNTQSEVIVYIPTSHVLLHDAEMLRWRE